jgi:hypothetical protein
MTPVEEEIEVVEKTPRGHDIGLLREIQGLSVVERLRRNSQMVRFTGKLRAAGERLGTRGGVSGAR